MFVLWPILAALAGLPACAGVLSLLFLLACASRRRERPAPATPSTLPTLAVIVPAHDEELVLAATLDSLSTQDYPPSSFQVVVVADNCTDGTAALARARGVTVLERTHADERGKGYALNHAVSHLLALTVPPEGFVIVDADTQAAPDFLSQMAARLTAHTDSHGLGAWQGRYGVLNAGDGWRAALMAGAFDLVNHVKPLGREMLGLSAGLKGNGMAFTRAVAVALPWPGGSLTEDLDYGLDLARRFGLRVAYVPEARVLAQMPADAAPAASQRARWERGRLGLLRTRALPLLAEGLRRRSFLLVDLAWDLFTPPLAELAVLILTFAALTGFGLSQHLLPHLALWLVAAAFCLLGLPVYVLGGLRVSQAPPEAYAALLRAPFYAAWKIALLLGHFLKRGRQSDEWVRTARAPLTPSETALPQASKVPPK